MRSRAKVRKWVLYGELLFSLRNSATVWFTGTSGQFWPGVFVLFGSWLSAKEPRKRNHQDSHSQNCPRLHGLSDSQFGFDRVVYERFKNGGLLTRLLGCNAVSKSAGVERSRSRRAAPPVRVRRMHQPSRFTPRTNFSYRCHETLRPDPAAEMVDAIAYFNSHARVKQLATPETLKTSGPEYGQAFKALRMRFDADHASDSEYKPSNTTPTIERSSTASLFECIRIKLSVSGCDSL